MAEGIGAFQDDAFQFDAFQMDSLRSDESLTPTIEALRNPLFVDTAVDDIVVTL